MAYTVNEMIRTDLRQEIARINCPVVVLGAWAENYSQSREVTQKIYEEQYKTIRLWFKMYDGFDFYSLSSNLSRTSDFFHFLRSM
jgi:hypothetical protein